MLTYGALKTQIRQMIWPSGEANNQVAAHDKWFLDSLISLQSSVDCLQQDNTQLVPHCATLYNCGLTVFDAPRGSIFSISVIDKINPTTGKEDATSENDWCSEIRYTQIDACHMRKFLSRAAAASGGCCGVSMPLFFGLSGCGKVAPTPTDEGVSKLPPIPLGFHYAQVSTDSKSGRARGGVWAIERGRIYLAPWIQSTETIVIKWDGLKRSWSDADPIDEDPLLSQAMEEYVRWKQAGKYDFDREEEARAGGAYATAVQDLIHQCREETRVRGCETSRARAGSVSTTTLFYNDPQQFTATCPDNTTGSSKTATIPAGTVASNISVADANQKAFDEAKFQAQAQLDCQSVAQTFTNDAQSFTAHCSSDSNSPTPDGNPVTKIVAAGLITSTVSKDDANAQALALAQAQAESALTCTFWNSEQSFTATCPEGKVGADVTKTIPAHTYSSTLSQSDADAQALNAAKSQAESAIVCNGETVFFENTLQVASTRIVCSPKPNVPTCVVVVAVTVASNTFTSTISQADANQQALNYANALAGQQAQFFCLTNQCGSHTINYP